MSALVQCNKLNDKPRVDVEAYKKESCYDDLKEASVFMKSQGKQGVSQLLESGANEFDPYNCKGHINLAGLGGALGSTVGTLNPKIAEKEGAKSKE